MAYVINKTNGQTLLIVQDGDSSTFGGVSFFGKKYPNYGKLQNENFVKLLENFANSTPPSSPLEGQLWWDSANKTVKIFDPTQVGGWVEIPSVRSVIGTVNQINVAVSGKTITLGLPQSIHTNASPEFSRLILNQPTGTSPIQVQSTTVITNLNADLLDGQDGSYYLNYNNLTNKPNIGSLAQQNSNSVVITGGTISGISPLPIESGGTGANTSESARTNLGIGLNSNPTFNTLNLVAGIGIAPLTVASQTLVSNLNADLLDGQDGNYYLDYNNLTNKLIVGAGLVNQDNTFAIGTPGTITSTTTNSVTTSSHTHAIFITKSDVGLGNVENIKQAAEITLISTGNGLIGGGDLSMNRTISLGTPSTINGGTPNSATPNSHTHTVSMASQTIAGVIKMRLVGNTLFIRNDGNDA